MVTQGEIKNNFLCDFCLYILHQVKAKIKHKYENTSLTYIFYHNTS